ncbi:uncharacterized protein LOC119633906 isoform X3 [Glossina fuscipes]|uniref:Dipeptidase n=1 Tax=Glossina fuscipes TaxID=7396 RepID=A0A8U0WEW2_9MUSC|nr:uncharacterized protein LOC119633906 isoform X3 [Glossina fuscipes]
MTDLKRSLDVGRVHQTTTKQNCHDAYRSSCSSTPELKSKHNCKNNSQTNEIADYRNPLLLTLQDHPHMSSNSGGSTSSTAIAATIIGCPGYMNGVAGAEIQFDEHDIYYVSPSKRKSSLSACQTPIMRGYERLRSFSPTSATATIVPSYPPIMPSAAYGARISGASGQNFSFESNDISAHYSDTAMQVLRSGSCSAMGSMLNSASANNSSTSSLAQQHLAPSQRGQNNVTFSNHISEQRASAVTTPQNRGSLRRNKGRSNQSLCSCDAGAETELNPDFTRPLYQYSLERRHKTHTYTCEQNAQILMRIERERKRKFSLSGNTGSDIIVGADAKDDTENDVSYLSDVETIPPVPPPPALKRNGSIRSLRLLQQHFQQHMSTSSSNNTTITTTQRSSNAPYNGIKVNKSNNSQHTGNNNSNGSIVTLCSGDLLNDCSKSVHDMRAVIDDCTTSILKCANAAVGSDIASTASTTTNGSYKPQVATLATITAQGKPDVCHVTTATAFGNCPPPYRFVDDDIVIPKSQKVDPALCFLHKTPTGTVGTGPPLGFVDLQQRTSQRDLQSMHKNKHSSSLSLSKYNTIGPSSDYARQLAIYNQQMLGQHDQSQQLPLLPPSSIGFDVAKHWLAVSSILLIIGAASVAVPLALRVAASAPFEERLRVALQLLDQVPLIDGHNDLPWNIRKFLHNKLNDFNFNEDLRNVMPWARSHWSHTDLTRLKKGRVSAQFWAAYVPCEAQHRDAVQLTLEQIDVIKRLTDRYAPQLTTCTSAQDIIEAHKNQQLCSLTGVEGGHSLGGSLAVLRTLYAIGVRYMTLTSTCHTPWADSSYADAPTFNVKHGGLTIFGKTIIREMNRLGMMVDLSHVSTGTMRDALEVSEAPVIFSHSSAYELCNSSRNVQDDMLQSLARNGGLIMVNFYSRFLSCSENSTVHDAVAHINHIKRVAGIDHVGLGAGYDGINFTPKGLEDVSSYPTLFAELLGAGWSIEDLTKLAGGNFLRVLQQVEKIRDEKRAANVKPYEDHPNFRAEDPYNCTSS